MIRHEFTSKFLTCTANVTNVASCRPQRQQACMPQGQVMYVTLWQLPRGFPTPQGVSLSLFLCDKGYLLHLIHLLAAAALEELWQGAAQRNRLSMLLLGRKGFEPVHYAAAALKLLDSQQTWNTVRVQDMQELLGRYVEGAASEEDARAAGAAVLESLVQATALSVRPPSDWARDIPVQAFGDDGGSIVTAHSTMDLYCWRRMRPELEEVLEEHDSAQ